MAFDLSTAKPEKATGGFDLSTAKPENGDLSSQQPPSKELGALDAAGMLLKGHFGFNPVASGEAALTMATAIPASIAGGVAGTVQALNPFADEGAGARAVEGFQEALTFQPRTAQGQQNLTDIGEGLTSAINAPVAGLSGIAQLATGQGLDEAVSTIENIQRQGGGKVAGDQVLDATGSPLLATGAQMLPDLIGGVFGLKQVAKSAGLSKLKASQKRQLIADEIKAGNPNVDNVTKILTESGDIVTSKPAKNAIKVLGDDISAKQTVSVLERMSPASKAQTRKMLNNVSKSRNEPLFDGRASNMLGESAANRAQAAFNVNKKAGKDIGLVAKSLKNKKVDIGAARKKFFESLDELGVKFNTGEDGFVTPDFSRSKFIGGNQKDMNVLVNDLLKNEVGFEFAHKLKRSIRDNVDFDKFGSAQVKGESQKILKDLSSGIDDVLDISSDTYNKANIKFAKTKGVVDEFQKMAGKDVDLFSDLSPKALGGKIKRITSNAESRVPIEQSLIKIDEVLADLGIKFTDDIPSLSFAANKIDEIFKTAPANSLEGNISRVAADTIEGKGIVRQGFDLAGKIFSKSEQKAFDQKMKVLMDLVKERAK